VTRHGASGAATLDLAEAGARLPAVAGSFYPDDPHVLRTIVTRQLAEAERRHPLPAGLGEPAGILVPHAGLEYSGVVAAAGWLVLRASDRSPGSDPTSVVILGTNHRAGWLTGVAAWDRGPWRTPLGDVIVDEDLADAVVGLGPPFVVDRDAHRGEHSIEVQLPFLQVVAPAARIVALAVSTGTGRRALEAGASLGALLAARREMGQRILLAISSDMAHYPSRGDAARVTDFLRPAILDIDAEGLAAREAGVRIQPMSGLACGMCGIEPAVMGLAALRAAGAHRAVSLAEATSADAGGPGDHTVGYLAAAFFD
jgi:Predicted dioxygenase